MPRNGSRTTVSKDLDAYIARTVAAPAVERVVREVAVVATVLAPAVKVWLSMRDDRVRESHDHTDGQAIPSNLRYKVTKGEGHRTTLMRVPRDPNAPRDEVIECRCQSVTDPDALRRQVHGSRVVVVGNAAVGEVSCSFHRVVESELGTSEDQGAHFMSQAAREVAARGR